MLRFESNAMDCLESANNVIQSRSLGLHLLTKSTTLFDFCYVHWASCQNKLHQLFGFDGARIPAGTTPSTAAWNSPEAIALRADVPVAPGLQVVVHVIMP